VKGPDDTSNIDKMFTNETPKETPGTGNLSPGARNENHFDQFTYAASAKIKGIKKPEK
jgi:Protein kinase C terminal domain